MFNNVYLNKSVFVTGHTGFKGSWLCSWLEQLGANVTGYALAPPTDPNHFDRLDLTGPSVIADIRDKRTLERSLQDASPEIIFHLAAQPSVLVAYKNPLETFEINVVGTANLLQIARRVPSVRSIIVVTTDKCYENQEWLYGYRENDRLGGYDPYSSSKACTELLVSSFRRSFFEVDPNGALIASARAGNVIGGGDWTADRLLPDAMRSAAIGESFVLRNPSSSRPWQHVLEPLSGYLCLGEALLAEERSFAGPWNFGPAIDSNLTTKEVIRAAAAIWPKVIGKIPVDNAPRPHEAGLLMVDSTKAHRRLRWQPVWDIGHTVEQTIAWYRAYYEEERITTFQQISAYAMDAKQQGQSWAQ